MRKPIKRNCFERSSERSSRPLRVLVACEESQTVCKAFRELGHEAYSCDIVECSGGHPEWHILSDVTPLVHGFCRFVTCDGQFHFIDDCWDLVIAHPPCTRLCCSSQRWLYFGSDEYRARKRSELQDAIDFFLIFTKLKCPFAIENPVGIMSTFYRKPDQIYNPFNFKGETEAKKTCLWLHMLPPLEFTQDDDVLVSHNLYKGVLNGKQYSWNDPAVARFRSVTPKGVAKAMAVQWSSFLRGDDYAE